MLGLVVGFVWSSLVVGFDCFSDFGWCGLMLFGSCVSGWRILCLWWRGLLSGFVGWMYLVVFVGVVCYGCVLIACGFIVAFITLLGFWCSLCGWVCGLVFDDLLCLLFEFGFWCSLCGWDLVLVAGGFWWLVVWVGVVFSIFL